MTFQAFCGRITDAQRQAEQRGCLRRCRKRDWKHRLGAWGPRGLGIGFVGPGEPVWRGAALGPGEPRLQVLVQWGLSFPHRCYQGAGPGMSHHLPSALYQLCDHRKGPALLEFPHLQNRLRDPEADLQVPSSQGSFDSGHACCGFLAGTEATQPSLRPPRDWSSHPAPRSAPPPSPAQGGLRGPWGGRALLLVHRYSGSNVLLHSVSRVVTPRPEQIQVINNYLHSGDLPWARPQDAPHLPTRQ